MSAERLISTMEKLLKLHKSLYEIAQKKTEIVKVGDIEALNQTLKDEQTHVAAISHFENDRQKIAAALVPTIEKPTIEDCLTVLDDGPCEALNHLRSELLDVIALIKQRNELNQKMIYQSLQFVNFSLNLIIPQRKELNYGPKVGKTNPPGHFSGIFNSKA
jgi:flagellar biosynthesis/type III secretory pathway chaperone